MLRHRFYDVPGPAYLFRSTPDASDQRKVLEEPIRQWCAFELIRAYGILVTDIVFEHPVKVGSKQYRVDIVVKRNNFPWIVVECKEPGYAKHDNAIAQAISYADAREIQAEFAVYTNGAEWLVSRKVQSAWVAVPDLPTNPTQGAVALRDIFHAIYHLEPLLFNLDDPIGGKDAKHFFHSMQVFFCGYNLLTEHLEQTLVHATDNICRVLSVEAADEKYRWGKLHAAAGDWQQYCARIGLESDVSDVDTGGMFGAELARVRMDLERIIRGTAGLHVSDVLLIRLDVALLNYAERAARKSEQFLPLTPDIHRTLRDFLNYLLTIHFNTQVPDPIDTDSTSDVKSYCRIRSNRP